MTKVAFQMYSAIFVCSSIEMHGRKREHMEGWGGGSAAGSGDVMLGVVVVVWRGYTGGCGWGGEWRGTSAQLLN